MPSTMPQKRYEAKPDAAFPRNIGEVLSQDGTQAGRVCGSPVPCGLEGCQGFRLPVRWPDGELTKPCTRGMTSAGPGRQQILPTDSQHRPA